MSTSEWVQVCHLIDHIDRLFITHLKLLATRRAYLMPRRTKATPNSSFLILKQPITWQPEVKLRRERNKFAEESKAAGFAPDQSGKIWAISVQKKNNIQPRVAACEKMKNIAWITGTHSPDGRHANKCISCRLAGAANYSIPNAPFNDFPIDVSDVRAPLASDWSMQAI